MKKITILLFFIVGTFLADNQTADVSEVLKNQPLPFTLSLVTADFTVPGGIQSAAAAQYGDEYLFIAGRTNGLHGFDNSTDNFPPSQQNTNVFVINVKTHTVYSRSLYDPLSGLTQQQIDSLSVTSPQYYQRGNTLYITGGYGVDMSTGNFSTKDTLTALDVPALIQWVTDPKSKMRASSSIRQISDPLFQVTGGQMFQVGKGPTLLIFGQNFQGFYTPSTTGDYTEQVRRFYIVDNGKFLGIVAKKATKPNANYRRRDLNVVPFIQVNRKRRGVPAFVALSGVFTPSNGAWTVPVEIDAYGKTYMADPTSQTTFKQAMNNYQCAHAELLSQDGIMYMFLFGGLTYGYFQNGDFFTDAELPFTNEITVVRRAENGYYTQYLLPTEYPTILSTASNPGNTLLFGAGGKFMPAADVPRYPNGVLNLAKITKPTIIGYIIGGIQSTLPNTSVPSDSAASPYIFYVILKPR